MKLSIFASKTGKLVADNAPGLLSGVGVVGALAASYFTAKATFKAADKMIEEAERREMMNEPEMVNQDRVKLVWKEYITPAGVLTLTVVAIVGSNRIGTRRAAALAAAYSLNNRAFAEYKEKVVEKLNPTKEKAIRDSVAQDVVTGKPLTGSSVIITGTGEVMCFDMPNQRYFKSEMEKIRRVQNDINANVIENGYATLSDLYVSLNLPTTVMSEEVGWTSDALLNIDITSVLSDNGQPCICINYGCNPIREYNHPALD